MTGTSVRHGRNAQWVDWFNHRRLFEPLGNVPPAEKEFEYYQSIESAVAA